MNERNNKTKELCFCGLMVALMAICSWIQLTIGPVPFTLQTFGVFAAVGLLGGKLGSISVLVFVILGAVGVPVFAGFSGGPSVIFGVTGGYILGFIFTALIMWLFEKLFGKGIVSLIISMVIGLAVCYAFGTAWFMVAYTRTAGSISLAKSLSLCVIPFIVPDLVKVACAAVISSSLRKPVQKMLRSNAPAA